MLKQLLFSKCIPEFIKERKSRNKSPRTVYLYNRELGYFQKWLIEKQYPDTIETLTPGILREWFSELGQHRNRGGVHCNFRIVKTFLRWLQFEYDDLTNWRNPINKVFLEPNKILPLPEIPINEVQQLLDVCNTRNGTRDKAILKTLCDTGCRGSELCSLDVQDIDLKTGSVSVKCGKGGKPRIIWLGEKSLKAVKEYLDSRENQEHNSPLFLNDDGNRLQFFGLRMLIFRLCQRAKIKTYGVHSFRRLMALTVYRKTHDIFLCSKILGHSRIETTIRYLNVQAIDLKNSFTSPADLLI